MGARRQSMPAPAAAARGRAGRAPEGGQGRRKRARPASAPACGGRPKKGRRPPGPAARAPGPTEAVSVKVAALRSEGTYEDLPAWLADTGQNLYVGRRGRVFVHDRAGASRRVFHYAGSKWQNPFVVGRDGSREEVCAKFRAALLGGELRDPADGLPLRGKLAELRGKRLGCWCLPSACHAQVLAELAEAAASASDR